MNTRDITTADLMAEHNAITRDLWNAWKQGDRDAWQALWVRRSPVEQELDRRGAFALTEAELSEEMARYGM